MNVCPHCGLTYSARVDFCFSDGTPLHRPEEAQGAAVLGDATDLPAEGHLGRSAGPVFTNEGAELTRPRPPAPPPRPRPDDVTGPQPGGPADEDLEPPVPLGGDVEPPVRPPSRPVTAFKVPEPLPGTVPPPEAAEPAEHPAATPRRAPSRDVEEDASSKGGLLVAIGVGAALLAAVVVGAQLLLNSAREPVEVGQVAEGAGAAEGATPTGASTEAAVEASAEPVGEPSLDAVAPEAGSAEPTPNAGATTGAEVSATPTAATPTAATPGSAPLSGAAPLSAANSATAPIAAKTTAAPTTPPATTGTSASTTAAAAADPSVAAKAATTSTTTAAAGQPWGAASATAESASSVSIESKPERARVVIDNEPIGTTPMMAQIPYGAHIIRVTLDGYREEARAIDVSVPSMRVYFDLKAKDVQGKVTVLGPPGAEIYVDGKPAPTAAPVQMLLSAGVHTFVLQLSDGTRQTKTVDVAFDPAAPAFTVSF